MADHASHADAAPGLLDWWIVALPLAVWTAYVLLATGQRQRGRHWSAWRTSSFTVGIILLAVAFSPPASALAHDSLHVHMVQHLVIGMFAPLALVLGAPMTLLIRAVPVTVGKLVSRVMRLRLFHLLTHPLTAMILTIGGMYLLYLTPLYAMSLDVPAVHGLVNIHFLVAGYLFTWSIAGPDPAPGRPSFIVRLAVLVASVGLHAFLGKLMYAYLHPRGVPFSAEEIREAAVLMYYGGDIAELLVAVALFASWYGQRRRRRLRQAAVTPLAPHASPVAPSI